MNYTALQADIAAYLHRTDLTTPIQGFIEKARLRIARDLRSLEQEQTTTLTGPTADVFTLPATLMELRRVEADGVPLRSVNPHELAYWLDAESPQVYSVRGRYLTAPGATTVDIWYFATEAALVSGSTEHPTMAAHPQVWMLASLLEAGLYTRDWELMDRCTAQYAAEVTEINKRAEKARQGTGPAVVHSDQYSTFMEAAN